ncbi:MAG TPA: CDP-alcohol phosphatidyltransferase family protein [Nitriliruptorales bacterium]
MAIKANFSDLVEVVVGPIGRGLARIGFTPNLLTSMGIILTGLAAWLVVVERPMLAGVVLIFGGLSDTFDGAVARARGTSSPFGGFYDSVSDRVSDGIILAALAWSVRDEPLLFGLVCTALVTALTTSYVRAKAESVGADCSVGLLERAERAMLVIAALILSFLLEPILWVLAVGGSFTVGQRVLHVRRQLLDRPEVFAGGRPAPRTVVGEPGTEG